MPINCLMSNMVTDDVLQFKGFGLINPLADADGQHHDLGKTPRVQSSGRADRQL